MLMAAKTVKLKHHRDKQSRLHYIEKMSSFVEGQLHFDSILISSLKCQNIRAHSC